MSFYISRHAEEELERRGIPREFLDLVLQNPQQIVEDRDGKKAYQLQFEFENGKTYLVRAIVAMIQSLRLCSRSIEPARLLAIGGKYESSL